MKVIVADATAACKTCGFRHRKVSLGSCKAQAQKDLSQPTTLPFAIKPPSGTWRAAISLAQRPSCCRP
jgi:hypothetical protein